VVLNASLDPAEGLTLTLRTAPRRSTVYDMNCAETRVVYAAQEGPTAYSSCPWCPLARVPAVS